MAEIKYPELKESTMSAELDAEQAAAEKRMREQERKARHDRDMAIFGDIANLFAQGAALHAGGKNVGRMQPATEVANERLRKLQESNSQQIAEYARQQIAARENKRKEDNAQKLAQYNAEVEQYKREQAQANTLARLEEQKRHNRAMEQIQTDREDRLEKQGGSSVNRDVFIVKDDGTKEYFRHAHDANNVQAAYARLPKEYRAEKAVPRTETFRGRKVYVKDSEGKQVYDYIEDLDASLEQKRQAISDYNNRELKKGNSWDGWKDGNATEDIDEDFE